ncbi:MAG: hypothetical protein KME14_15265 [Tildeniella torsiva UHER 1998/13D]|jgi:ribosomal protein L37AE/L43A|nr:hypothetical protein [Tildeniella torsiva UHER 1998/13D]
MAQQHPCPHCNNQQLLRIGVRGIRQCARCKAYVDVRFAKRSVPESRHWLKRLIRDRAA